MTLNLRIRLSLMMFLELFVWGAWLPVLNTYMDQVGFKDKVGEIYGLLGLASIFMPLIAGQITDRIVATQIFLGVAHIVGAAGLIVAALASKYTPFYTGMLIWALAYAPTVSLTNSLSFTHLKDAEKEFGFIRVFGTLGWILSNWALSGWRRIPSLVIGGNDCLYLAAGAALIMGLFCFTLPNTPPARSGVSAFAFAKALGLLRNPRVAVFLLVSFAVGVASQFYFAKAGPFLKALGATDADNPVIQSLGQVSEIAAMLALPFCLKAYGPRLTLFLGVMAWAIRFLIFALGTPYGLVVASIPLHGFAFTFFFVVGFIYIDMVAPKDIKASAQGLLTLIVFGLGFWIGGYVVDVTMRQFTRADATVQWGWFFLVPGVMTIICAAVFMLTFPKGSMKEAATGSQQGTTREAS